MVLEADVWWCFRCGVSACLGCLLLFGVVLWAVLGDWIGVGSLPARFAFLWVGAIWVLECGLTWLVLVVVFGCFLGYELFWFLFGRGLVVGSTAASHGLGLVLAAILWWCFFRVWVVSCVG